MQGIVLSNSIYIKATNYTGAGSRAMGTNKYNIYKTQKSDSSDYGF